MEAYHSAFPETGFPSRIEISHACSPRSFSDLQTVFLHSCIIEITILSSITNLNSVSDVFFRFPNPAPLLTTLLIRFDHDVKAPNPESSDGDDTFSPCLLFGKQLPTSLKSLRSWTVTLSLTLATLTLTLLYFSANDLYPCLKAMPNLTFLCSVQHHVVV
jgi:hypothetical protein